MRRLLSLLTIVVLCVCATSCRNQTIAGVWGTNSSLGYYFELYEDGTCVMFDEHDEWVSAGNYTAFEDHVEFRTDTGDFTWVWDEEFEAMVFEAGNTTYYFQYCAPIGASYGSP